MKVFDQSGGCRIPLLIVGKLLCSLLAQSRSQHAFCVFISFHAQCRAPPPPWVWYVALIVSWNCPSISRSSRSSARGPPSLRTRFRHLGRWWAKNRIRLLVEHQMIVRGNGRPPDVPVEILFAVTRDGPRAQQCVSRRPKILSAAASADRRRIEKKIG